MKSISMSAGTVLAICEGRKTQTRRLSKLKKVNATPDDWQLIDCVLNPYHEKDIPGYWAYFRNERDIREYRQVARWQENEILYVKEPWKLIDAHPIAKDTGGDLIVRVQYITSPDTHKIWFTPERYTDLKIMRKADIKPAMFMPKEVARFNIEVKDIRIERAYHISAKDIKAEGIEVHGKGTNAVWRYPTWSQQMKKNFKTDVHAWEWLWNKVNPNCRLNENPWCWVIEFSTCGNRDV